MKTLFFAAALWVSSSAMAQDYYGGYQNNDYLRPGSQAEPRSQPEVGRMKNSDYESMRNRVNQPFLGVNRPFLGSDMDSRARERLDREEEKRKERNYYDGY